MTPKLPPAQPRTLLWALGVVCVALLGACGPGVGGSGTGAEPDSLGAFGATAAPVCDSTLAPQLVSCAAAVPAATLFAANLQDHAAAAVANLQGEANFLEQAVFVDQITAESAQQLHSVSVAAWQQAFKLVMQQAQVRFDADAPLPAAERRHRARFGVYFYSEREDETDAPPAP